MKIKVTKKSITSSCDCIAGYYGEFQNIENSTQCYAYTCGVYGWNADIYLIGHNVALVTGYRSFGSRPDAVIQKLKEIDARLGEMHDYKQRMEYAYKELWQLASDYKNGNL